MIDGANRSSCFGASGQGKITPAGETCGSIPPRAGYYGRLLYVPLTRKGFNAALYRYVTQGATRGCESRQGLGGVPLQRSTATFCDPVGCNSPFKSIL